MGEKLFLFTVLVFFCVSKYKIPDVYQLTSQKSERFKEGFWYFSHLMMEKQQELFFFGCSLSQAVY